MKQFFLLVGILSMLFHSCKSSEKGLTQNDLIGTWVSSENAEFIFNGDGTFTGSQIPAEFGFFPIDTFRNVKFNGSGKWELRKAEGAIDWEVYLNFNKVDVKGKNGCVFSLLVGGEKGIMENKPPWYLFVWKGEEGGERYEFHKK